jgi:radical SAM protein with 4Fe4S-binding SPASM domain
MPFFLSVEVTNYCNLHCLECPVGKRKNSTAEKTVFDFSLFKKLIDELTPTLQHLILYFQGEPMLNYQLNEFIQYAHEAKIYTSTSTNGQFINKNNAKKLVESGLDKLIVSMDGTTQEIYELYRVGGKLERAIEGIKEIMYWRNKLKSVTPLVEIQFLVLKTNEHQMDKMKLLSKSLNVDRLTFKTAQLYDFENGNALMPSKERYSRYKMNEKGKYILKGSQHNRCRRLWNGAVVTVSGDVLPCCFDKASEYSFGNLHKQSFSACWHSKKATGFRDKILQNRKQFEICRNCTNN